MLALIAGQIPTNDQKQAYFGKLRAKQTICDGEILTKQAFIKVSLLAIIGNTVSNIPWFCRSMHGLISARARKYKKNNLLLSHLWAFHRAKQAPEASSLPRASQQSVQLGLRGRS